MVLSRTAALWDFANFSSFTNFAPFSQKFPNVTCSVTDCKPPYAFYAGIQSMVLSRTAALWDFANFSSFTNFGILPNECNFHEIKVKGHFV